MARIAALRTTALDLALRLLLGLGLGLEAAPTSGPTQTSAQALGSCSPPNFQCRTSGFCVPLPWRCDGDWDCADGSDEDECRIQPCAQTGQCPLPQDPPCFCDSISHCPGGTDKNLHNCSRRQPCPPGQLPCKLGDTCVPHTWHCDNHPDCPDASDELGCEIKEAFQEGHTTTLGDPVTLEAVTSLTNATASSVGDQSGNSSAYGVIAAAVWNSGYSTFVLKRVPLSCGTSKETGWPQTLSNPPASASQGYHPALGQEKIRFTEESTALSARPGGSPFAVTKSQVMAVAHHTEGPSDRGQGMFYSQVEKAHYR